MARTAAGGSNFGRVSMPKKSSKDRAEGAIDKAKGRVKEPVVL